MTEPIHPALTTRNGLVSATAEETHEVIPNPAQGSVYNPYAAQQFEGTASSTPRGRTPGERRYLRRLVR